MLGFFIFTSCLYVWAIYWATRLIYNKLIYHYEREFTVIKESYQNEYLRKFDIENSKKALETKAAEIFALYDITKEITRTFNEQDAFIAFKNKLKDNIYYQDCKLLDPLSGEVKVLQKAKDYFLFTLRGKTRLLGYLAIKGVEVKDKEKVTIMAHQYALALQRIRLYQEIERLAMVDSLTDVSTRRYILERFEEELSRAKIKRISLSFLMIDVDHFKRFNDEHGHLTGDQILREIALIIQDNIREIDIMGRYGGEEFCVVLPDTDHEGAYYVAERIRVAVEKTKIKAYDTTTKATISIGIASFPQDGKLLSELIDKADWALYRAKKRGRNNTCAFGVYKD